MRTWPVLIYRAFHAFVSARDERCSALPVRGASAGVLCCRRTSCYEQRFSRLFVLLQAWSSSGLLLLKILLNKPLLFQVLRHANLKMQRLYYYKKQWRHLEYHTKGFIQIQNDDYRQIKLMILHIKASVLTLKSAILKTFIIDLSLKTENLWFFL